MNNYIKNLQVCIDELLIKYSIDTGKSILYTDLTYHYHISEISKIYAIPKEHYSKILTLAYNKTVKEWKK